MEDNDILRLHEQNNGVLDIHSDLRVKNSSDLAKAYTPGVASLSKAIVNDPDLKAKVTLSGKLVALVTDGSAVLGLGNIGPDGGLPVVEGKALLYKDLANVNALPMAVDQVAPDEFVKTIKNIQRSFAGIHLEDIAAPRCFEIEEKLSKELNIPVYHDDQEGTAVVVLAGLINAAKVAHKRLKDLKIVINGVGASGVATASLLDRIGLKNITLVDVNGVIQEDSPNTNKYQRRLASRINSASGKTLDEVIDGQDVFIGLSTADVLSAQQVKRMAEDPIIFALANPQPEIKPDQAKKAGASVIATGSSQYPNQVNNILVFPGLFKGMLESKLNLLDYKVEAVVAQALAGMISEPTAEKIIPGVFDDGVVETVSKTLINFSENGAQDITEAS